jgi:transcriptional regulator with XRE-family HTH domain
MEFNLTRNFNDIFAAVSNKGVKRTAFAKAMGYSSTSQLAATLEGEALISTKAIIELVKNFKINPTFLFTGQGEIFLPDESEIEKLRKENHVLTQNNDALVKTTFELNKIIQEMDKRYIDLIDITSTAIKYHKEHKDYLPEVEKKEGFLKLNKK